MASACKHSIAVGAWALIGFTTANAIAAEPAREKWTTFRNMEFYEYCLSLPLEGYAQDRRRSDVKAKHVFTHRNRKQGDITLWGLDSAPSKTTPEAYFKRYYEGAAEQGLVIEERKLDAANKRFYGWGYWSNSYYESRFLEIVWLRDGEIVKFHATFPVADVALWKARLPKLFAQTSRCAP